MRTDTLDGAKAALDSLKAIAGQEHRDPDKLSMAALIVGEHVDNLLALIADQQRQLDIAQGAIRSGQDSLTTARREANQHRRTATLMADTLAMSERRPHRHPVESARVLGIVRGIAANMPADTDGDGPEPTPAKPALITPGARRWWSTPAIHPTNTAVR